ncbi:MAG: hypothetical protein RL030_1058 [Pseudomonadota bacterium]|jgi:hypothetical protein
MKPLLALAALCLAAPTFAETFVVGAVVEVRSSSVQTPPRGALMSTVEANFGEPRLRHAAVGQPPITRWDYDGFSVYFENNHVIHAVATAP